MKRRNKEKSRGFVIKKGIIMLTKILALGIICFGMTFVLISWNRVPRFQHYLFLSHPFSTDKEDHFVCANIDLILTNGYDDLQDNFKQDLTERYSFSILNKEKKQGVLKPEYHAIDSVLRFISRNVDGRISMKDGTLLYCQGLREAKGIEISNMFGIVHFSSKPATPFTNHPKVQKCNNGIVFVKHEKCEDLSSNGLWWEESTFLHNMETFREQERLLEARDLMFNYPEDGMSFQTAYVSGFSGCNDIEASISCTPVGWLKRTFRILLAPYDITKAQFDCVVFSHEIDSLNVRFKFIEGVKISDAGNIKPSKSNMFSIDFPNVGRINSTELSNFIYRTSPAKMKIQYGDVIRQKNESGISLFVSFLSCRNIQWLRLFILTTILAYCYFSFAKSFSRFCIYIIKTRKK